MARCKLYNAGERTRWHLLVRMLLGGSGGLAPAPGLRSEQGALSLSHAAVL